MNMDVDCGDDIYYFSTKDWSAGCRHHNSYSVTLSLIKSLWVKVSLRQFSAQVHGTSI